MLKMETKPPTTDFEDLCGLAPLELANPVDTTVPLPALLQPHWTDYSFVLKETEVSQGLGTCCSFCLEHCPPPHYLHR